MIELIASRSSRLFNLIQLRSCNDVECGRGFFAGHGSSSGPTWGSPAVIDEVYLRNPMEPLDVLEMKDPSVRLMKEPRRPNALPVADATKFKKQFNYVRLSEDVAEAADPTSPSDDPLLIDLSSDSPVIISLLHLVEIVLLICFVDLNSGTSIEISRPTGRSRCGCHRAVSCNSVHRSTLR